ncbi:nucleotidyltransferase domain-containing protein [Endothiovibrio diazotrophicus]
MSLPEHTSPEMALIIAAALPGPRARLIACARAVGCWDEALRLARYHGVLALCQRALTDLPAGLVPADVLEKIKRRVERNRHRSLHLTAELVGLLQALREAGVEVLPFKGPALSERLFGSPLVRPPGDLDLLIRPDALSTADGVLRARGYLPRSPRFPVDRHNRQTIQRVRPDIEYLHPQHRQVVELHWRWQRNPWLMRLDEQRVWGERREQPLGGRTVPALDDRELLLYLCVHGCRHRWYRLKWLADVAWWLDDPAGIPERRALLERAGQTGARTALYATQALLERLGAPQFDLPRPRPAAADAMADHCLHLLTHAATDPEPTALGLARGLWMEWKMSDSWRARLHGIIWARFLRPNDNDMETLLLPPRLTPLYVFLKPLLWFWRRVRAAHGPSSG